MGATKKPLSPSSEGNHVDLSAAPAAERLSLKARQALAVSRTHRIIRFCGQVLFMNDDEWQALSSDDFARICYSVLGLGIKKTEIKDLQHLFFTSADDKTELSRYLAFPDNRVWDMRDLEFTTSVAAEDCVYRTAVSPTSGRSHRKWLEEVSCGDVELADDIMQALAPTFMAKKPFGVFWFLGGGANGKSTTLKALYAIMGSRDPYTSNRWFSQLSVKQIEDERDVPTINGKLGNICLESNDGTVRDSSGYKNIAEHSSYSVHKFNSQEGVTINGNVHAIFNANNIPTFSDKTQGVRRRTFTIPFNARFPQDNTFDKRLFSTKGFLSDLLGELLEFAQRIKSNNYKYDFSPTTMQAKLEYDEEVNTAESYFEDLIEHEIYGFSSFTSLSRDYQVWCDDRSLVTLGKKSIARAAKMFKYERLSTRSENGVIKRYVRDGYDIDDLEPVPMRPGLLGLIGRQSVNDLRDDSVGGQYEDLLRSL